MEENREGNLLDHELSSLRHNTKIIIHKRKKIDELNFITIKKCASKFIIKKMKKQTRQGKKYL